jgi:hypothetical protein
MITSTVNAKPTQSPPARWEQPPILVAKVRVISTASRIFQPSSAAARNNQNEKAAFALLCLPNKRITILGQPFDGLDSIAFFILLNW